MKSLILVVVLGLICCSCKTSNYIKYHRIINEAEYSFYQQDYNASSQQYSQAFKKVKQPFERDMYFYAVSLWEIHERDQAIMLMDTLYGLDWILSESGYFDDMDLLLKEDLLRSNVENTELILIRRNESKYAALIDSLWLADQAKRIPHRDFQIEFPFDTVRQKSLWEEINTVDAMNIAFLDSLIKADGFFGGINMPESPNSLGHFLIHHPTWVLNNEKWLLKAIKKGAIFPADYARIYDKALLERGDSTVYYGYFGTKLGNVTPETIFKRCKRIGLSPYYIKTTPLPRKNGVAPINRHFYYDYYELNKDKFCCY